MPRRKTQPHKDTRLGSLVRPGLAGSHTAYLHTAGVRHPGKGGVQPGKTGVGLQVPDGRILAEAGRKVLIK